MKTAGSPAVGPSPWIEKKISAMRPPIALELDISRNAGVHGHGAHAEAPVSHAPEADLLHEARQLCRGDEAIHRLRQIGIGLAVAADELADARHEVVEVEAEQRGEARQGRL